MLAHFFYTRVVNPIIRCGWFRMCSHCNGLDVSLLLHCLLSQQTGFPTVSRWCVPRFLSLQMRSNEKVPSPRAKVVSVDGDWSSSCWSRVIILEKLWPFYKLVSTFEIISQDRPLSRKAKPQWEVIMPSARPLTVTFNKRAEYEIEDWD